MNNKKILIGILRSKENEFDICLKKLKEQTYSNYNFFVIENMPNKLAHDQLYTEFMSNSNNYHYFLKLDADMVFVENDSLKKMVALFDQSIGHIMFYVNDIPSSLKIPGIQMFKSDITWTFDNDSLRVDYAPNMNGLESRIFSDINVIDHMPMPSNFQLFSYGIHKAIKSIQPYIPNKTTKHLNKGLIHISIINGISRNYLSGNHKLIWSLIGAMLVYKKVIEPTNYMSDVNLGIFKEIENDKVNFDLLVSDAKNFWLNEIQNMFSWSRLFHSI